ncbi:MAG TPA: NADH-quinone oxidoreductase subunit C, partial [Spirillospora sp.]|nr:NADH-quinone oxidoreductase subunit C [Spirillospora sp.]
MAIAVPQTTKLNLSETLDWLKQRYPDAVKDDERQGFSGVIVDKNRLREVAQVIRDELGFDYLSSATAVDYFGISNHMEMVYH